MLAVLKISNIAIIENAEMEFSRGFHVLTGETGAGKSIVLDAINAILGYRTSKELIRTGESEAGVEALFTSISPYVKAGLSLLGLPDNSDGTLVISRTITPDKSICRVNGTLTAVSSLRSLGERLVQIHGQQDNRLLLDSGVHLSYIDAVAGNTDALDRYRAAYYGLVKLRDEIKRLSGDEQEKARRLDILKYQIDELTAAQINPGEWEQKKNRRTELRNFERIQYSLKLAYDALTGGDEPDSAISIVGGAMRALSEISEYSATAAQLSDTVSEAYYSLEDVSEALRSELSSGDFSQEELSETEERLDVLFKLSKKYGNTEEEMLSYLEKAKKEYSEIAFSGERLLELCESEKKQLSVCKELSSVLSKTRKTAAKRFSESVCSELEFLDMPEVRFEVRFDETNLCENGTDTAEFYISANVGEEPKPLGKIASGGELSRIMLALKNVLSDNDGTNTLIFDEIDSGVSGRAAEKVAAKLKEISKSKQVICVTHLSQLMCKADIHLKIEKSVHDKKTYTTVTALDFAGRTREVARITGGINPTQLQLENARELLKSSGIKED